MGTNGLKSDWRSWIVLIIGIALITGVFIIAKSQGPKEAISAQDENIKIIQNGSIKTIDETVKTFHLVANRSETTEAFKWWTLIYTDVFSRLGMELEMSYYPLKRASYEASEGNVDGEPLRIYEYADAFPNLIRVEEPIYPMRIVAYKNRNSTIPPLTGWKSLQGTRYHVQYPRGMKITEDNLPGVVSKDNLSTVTYASDGFKILSVGRSDLYVGDYDATYSISQLPEYKNNICVAGEMTRVNLYLYVHKKHKHLAPRLAETIRDLKAEGLIEKYRKEAYGIISN